MGHPEHEHCIITQICPYVLLVHYRLRLRSPEIDYWKESLGSQDSVDCYLVVVGDATTTKWLLLLSAAAAAVFVTGTVTVRMRDFGEENGWMKYRLVAMMEWRWDQGCHHEDRAV